MYQIDKIQKESRRIHTIGGILSVILYLILIPMIIFNFTLIIRSFLYPNETPDFFGYKSFVIMSGSMEPTIMTGDAILVKEVPEEELKVNDIISFNQQGTNVTHRIIAMDKEKGKKVYQTKGDNNHTPDKEKITYEQIEGIYQVKIPQFGRVIGILKNKVTLCLLILMVICIWLYKKRIEKRREQRKEKRKKYEEEKEEES